jgi:hypothetical protein
MKLKCWMHHEFVEQVVLPQIIPTVLAGNEGPNHWPHVRKEANAHCAQFITLLLLLSSFILTLKELLLWIKLCAAIHRWTSGLYLLGSVCVNACSSTSGWNETLHRRCNLKKKERVAPRTSSRRIANANHRLYNAWCNGTRQTVCNHLGFNTFVIFKI